jgi:hypothetical protein
MKKFREELEKINADKSLNPEKKMKARDSARKRRNAKLAQILTEEQMKKFRKIWRANARPGNGPDGGREDGDSPCTTQQKAQMKRLMYWFSTQVKQILNSRLSEEEKNKRIAKLKNTYRQKRSQILSPEQARAWAAKDGVSFPATGRQSAGGPEIDSGDRDQRGGKPDGKRGGKPDSGCGFIPRSGDPTEEPVSN